VARRSDPRPGVLAAVDAAALVVFALVGAMRHGEGFDPGVLVRTGLPVLVAWFALSFVVGTYRHPGWATLALTWLVAIPIGLIARSTIRGGPWGSTLLRFGAVAMAFTALFLVVGRLLVLAVSAIRSRRTSASAEAEP
jgi:hypothetical protein